MSTSKPRLQLFLLIICIVASSCSTKTNGFLNRAYHNTTARYNGYFYSRESIKEGLKIINDGHQENFEALLPVYILPTETTAPSIFPQMERAITKSAKVISKHSMQIGGEERCRWIDDNYVAIANAHFYKRTFPESVKIFDYVTKEYKDPLTKSTALLGLAKTHIQSGDLLNAGLVLSSTNEFKDFPKKLLLDRAKMNAWYQLERGNYLAATDFLNEAIKLEKKKKQRNRLMYILAQTYQLSGKTKEALNQFDLVADASNDYTMTFNARIFQALAVENKIDSYRVKDDLLKMLRDDKNKNYLDQLYYALAEISFKDRKEKEALDYLVLSTHAESTNNRQKSKTYLRLAQYYFDQKLYAESSDNFDSSLTVLDPEAPGFADIEKTAKSLDELVKELRVIARQDSLQYIADMDEDERSRKLKDVARQLQQEEERRIASASGTNGFTPQNQPIQNNQVAAVGNFYFYNSGAKTSGLADFKKKWGARVLEDNWRRAKKTQSEGGVAGFDEDENESKTTTSTVSDINIQDLAKNLPLTPQALKLSNDSILESLYSTGNIYKEKFKDNESSIEAFQNLIARFKDTKYHANVYYQLYRMFLAKESKKGAFSFDTKSSSTYYKDLIITEYPNSEFAKLVENPDYLKNVQANAQNDFEDYKVVYSLYKGGEYPSALQAIDSVITAKPGSLALPKFYFLQARVQSEMRNVEGFRRSLGSVISKFPKSPEATEAKLLLDRLNKFAPDTVKVTAPIIPVQDTSTALFSISEASEHYLIAIFPSKNVDIEKEKINLANFNSRMYTTTQFQMNSTFWDNDHYLVSLKSFKDKADALSYYKVLQGDQQMKSFNTSSKDLYVLSTANFIKLYNNKKTEEYRAFFKENYK